nr:sulfotransferase [Pirellulimonas nuda]
MTSTLHEQLAAQPGVFMCTPKEPCYFSDDEVYARGENWYRGLFDDARPGDLRGESSTHYTKLPTYPATVERMHAAFPRLKLIYVMRHPVDRLVSQYMHEWSVRNVNLSIDDAIDAFPGLIDYGRYARQLAPYLEAFGPCQVLPVFFERLKVTPQGELERITDFLGLGQKPAWNDEVAAQNRSNERLRTSRLRDAVVHAPGISWLRRTLVPKRVRDRVKSLWRLPAKPELRPETEARLLKAFDDDLRVLGGWLSSPLSCERFREVVSRHPLEWRPGLSASLLADAMRQEAMA